MNKIMIITVIALVAVVMGMSVVAPMIPQAEALPGQACDAIRDAADRIEAAGGTVPPKLQALVDHCAVHE